MVCQRLLFSQIPARTTGLILNPVRSRCWVQSVFRFQQVRLCRPHNRSFRTFSAVADHETKRSAFHSCHIGDSTIRAIHGGKAIISAIRHSIAFAKHEILLEIYWIDSLKVGNLIADDLIAARKRGVNVVMIYDSVGCYDTSKAIFDKLRGGGCEVLEYNPMVTTMFHYRPDRLFRRTHRKMVVIDKRVAFTGGMNFADQWLPVEDGGRAWMDVMIKVKGPAATQFSTIIERMLPPLRAKNDDRGNVPTHLQNMELWRHPPQGEDGDEDDVESDGDGETAQSPQESQEEVSI
jgi:phosphatidylserine/phosphatidylglycerophosphate/cardiolipin synthase-like enzyme